MIFAVLGFAVWRFNQHSIDPRGTLPRNESPGVRKSVGGTINGGGMTRFVVSI